MAENSKLRREFLLERRNFPKNWTEQKKQLLFCLYVLFFVAQTILFSKKNTFLVIELIRAPSELIKKHLNPKM